jgi:phosphate transport system protein
MPRVFYTAELEQVRLQIEVMSLRVGDALDQMRDVLRTGDLELAQRAVDGDDEIDAMLVSITERCYDLIRRESPVASDLRFLVSALRILEELERIGDLSLRVVKQAGEHQRLVAQPAIFHTLVDMADVAHDVYRSAVDAWAAQDIELAVTLADNQRVMDANYSTLLAHILELGGPDGVQVAVASVLIGRSLERIADHTVIVGERLRYLLTGDPAYLAAEVRR